MIVAHLVIGATGIAAGLFFLDGKAASIAMVLGAMAYVAWTTGRLAGLAFAVVTGSIQVLRADQVEAGGGVVFAALWAALYLLIVVIASGIEAATRPVNRGVPEPYRSTGPARGDEPRARA